MSLSQSTIKQANRSRHLQILSTRLVSTLFAGTYKSVFRGRGMEFGELCDYQPGDDIRNIDWNVTARSGRPFIKRFVEEREMTVMILLDRSASLNCPSPARAKYDAAQEVSAILATVAGRNNDRAGLITFGEGVQCYIPPGKGLRHTRRLITEIASNRSAASASDLAAALNYLNSVIRRPVILFIISDFICTDFTAPLASAARRHDTVAIAVNDPHDLNLLDVGLLQVADAETGQRRVIDTGSVKVRSEYARLAAIRMADTYKTVTAAGAELLPLATTVNPVQALSRFFQTRQRRSRSLA